MKAIAGTVCLGLAILLSGCDQKSDSNTASTTPTNGVGNPLTAPADYLGVLAKAQSSTTIKVDTIGLNNAIQQYQALEGHLPKDLNELVAQHYYPRIPKPPVGMKYDYNPSTGKVALVPQ